jgi:predicted PurR-regulated permease PerM
MGLLPLYSLAAQEAVQWDLRSLHLPFAGLLVFLFLLLVPVVQLLRRTGHNPVWCILALFTAINLIAFWLFAFKPWPTDRESRNVGNA